MAGAVLDSVGAWTALGEAWRGRPWGPTVCVLIVIGWIIAAVAWVSFGPSLTHALIALARSGPQHGHGDRILVHVQADVRKLIRGRSLRVSAPRAHPRG